MAGPALIVSPQARSSYLALYSIQRSFSISARHSNNSGGGQFHRSDFTGQGFTGYYDPNQPTTGPLGDASSYGAPRITPKVLKQHLDEFVVGQERAKKVLSVAVYNHYQRIQEIQRKVDEEEALAAQRARREMTRHPVEVDADEFPGQQPTVNIYAPSPQGTAPAPPPLPSPPPSRYGTAPILDNTPLTIEKSNVLLLGPSGVGKTLMAKTLARVLEVPFSMSDCTPFTQAGYIGEDADVCVQRLLAAANYDVARAERGIICLDEIDKIATAKVSHGKDVSGEGVQQALLKIIEGTTIQVQAKQERNSGAGAGGGRGPSNVPPGGLPSNGPLSGGNVNVSQPSKGETYNVQTDNILFICTGAFNGLHRNIMDRIAKGSIGFGANVRSTGSSSSSNINDPTMKANSSEEELFKKNLPFYDSATQTPASDLQLDDYDPPAPTYNSLDLTTPEDLQKFGLIPELVGRIPITCAVSPLSLPFLMRVLTEPRNSLLSQYTQLFALSGIELRFTTPALREVAAAAEGMGTGARGLRTVMERLLSEAMFEVPGSHIRHILITERVARKEEGPVYFGRGMQARFHALIASEEEDWEMRKQKRREERDEAKAAQERPSAQTFEQYRQLAGLSGSG